MHPVMNLRASVLLAALVAVTILTGACTSSAPPVYAARGPVVVDAYPAVGTVWASLPPGCRAVTVGHRDYYSLNGIFYRRSSGRYVVIGAPVGATVRRLPSGARAVKVRGRRYYSFHGAYYRYDSRKRTWLVVTP